MVARAWLLAWGWGWGSPPACLPALLGAPQGVTPPYIGASPALVPPQLQPSDFAVLKRLVPLLEELSRTYPEPLTQELASDLRIAILTHGACSPGTVGAAADGVLGRKPGTGAQSPAGTAGRAPRPPSPRHGHGSPSVRRERSGGQSPCREPGACGASPAPCADSPAPAGLQELLLSAYDPQPPSRAAALRHLASLVTRRHPEALRLQEKLLQVPGSCCGPCPLPWSLSPAVSSASRAGAEHGDGRDYWSPLALLAQPRVTADGTFLPSRCSWRMCSTRMPSSTSQPSKVSSACQSECQHFVRGGFVLWSSGHWEQRAAEPWPR